MNGRFIKLTRGLVYNPDAAALRREVFMQEQGFQNEFDEADNTALHLTVYAGDKPVGTARLLWPDSTGVWHIGRVAVRRPFRSQGWGAVAVRTLEQQVKIRGGGTVVLLAQLPAVPFYEKLGYTAFGKIEDDEGCPHRHMKKEILPIF